MARVTVEDCLERMNRFDLVHAAALRADELIKGATPHHECKNNEIVTALREIADGDITLVIAETEEVATETKTKSKAKKKK
jgi:DNA-directed RNA polymerase omega subunit